MNIKQTLKTCTIRRKVVVGATVCAEFPLDYVEQHIWKNGRISERSAAEMADILERKCREFHDFLRNCPDAPGVQLCVERHLADICSACGRDWEAYRNEGGVVRCVGCGATLAETERSDQ